MKRSYEPDYSNLKRAFFYAGIDGPKGEVPRFVARKLGKFGDHYHDLVFGTRSNIPKSESLDLRRELSLEIKDSAIDEKARTVGLTFATETPYERWFGFEVLSCNPAHVRMGRLNNGGALLKDHDRGEQTGVVVRNTAKTDAKSASCTVKFSRNELGEAEFTDVKDGIRTLVSVGYIVHHMTLQSKNEDVETYLVDDWEPYEVSIVSIPADPGCCVGKFDDQLLTTKEQRENMLRSLYPHLMRAPAPATRGETGGGGTTQARATTQETEEDEPPAPRQRQRQPGRVERDEDTEDENERATGAERNRISEIQAIVDKIGTEEVKTLGKNAIAKGMPLEKFHQEILTKHFKATPIETPSPDIGLSAKEVKRFSLMKACRDMAFFERLEGFEKEVCEATAKHLKRDNKQNTIVVPDEVARAAWAEMAFRQLQTRTAQNASTFTQGGATVQDQYGPMIEFLRNKTILGQLGITIITGLVGDFVLPVQTGGATAYWVSETGTLSDTLATFGQKKMLPHRLGATIPFTSQFLAQTSISAEEFLRNELMTVMALKKDVAGLHGTGADGQPLGIQNTTGINADVTFGGAAEWADVVEFETGIAVDNADIGSMGFALSSATVGKWKTILKSSVAGATYLLEGGGANMSANGYPVKRTNQIAGDIAFFGVWSQLILGAWAGLEVVVDPYALKKSGQIEITMNELCDFLTRQPLAFEVSTDSAAQ